MKKVLHFLGVLCTLAAGFGVIITPVLSTNQKFAGVAALVVALATNFGSAFAKVESTLPVLIGLLWTSCLLSSCGCATLSGSDAGQNAKSAVIDCTSKTVVSLAQLGAQGVVGALNSTAATQADLKNTAEGDAAGWIVCVALEFSEKCVASALACDPMSRSTASDIVANAKTSAIVIAPTVPLIPASTKPVSTVSPYPGNWLEAQHAIYAADVAGIEALYRASTIDVSTANTALCLDNIAWQETVGTYNVYIGFPAPTLSGDLIAQCVAVL